MKVIDLTQPLSVHTPPWPTYEPLQIKYFKRISSVGANGQLITTSHHVGTHMDGEIHFWNSCKARTIGQMPLEFFVGPAAVVDLSDISVDYGIYTPKDIESRVEVKKGDILIIHTGYLKYAWYKDDGDEIRYMVCHPGPTMEFADWCIKKNIKWIGVDCGSADHPMNTIIRKWRPEHAKKADTYMRKKYKKSLEEIFPDEHYQLMHIKLFPKGIIHAENLGGDIEKVLNKRIVIGAFPLPFMEGESAQCRIVAFPDAKI
ncbi:cyclase family protein [bacterium]|nr:cyclase family protein [bacterium]